MSDTVKKSPQPRKNETLSKVKEKSTVRDLLQDLIKDKNAQLDSLKKETATLKSILKTYESEIKSLATPPPPPPKDVVKPKTGVNKPIIVSPQMYEFLGAYGVKDGELVSLASCVKFISTYIKEHSLFCENSNKDFATDDTLQKLFLESDGSKYTLTKLASYIKHHTTH